MLPALSEVCEWIVVMGRIKSATLALSDAGVSIGEPAESSDGNPDLTTGRPSKSRRNRVRAREVSQTGCRARG